MADLKTSNIKTISSLSTLTDVSGDDVIMIQDVSETDPKNAYKKRSLREVVDLMNPIQSVNLTTAEYNALTDAQKNNGTYYNITDSESTVQDELATLSATVATQADTITALQSELNAIKSPTWYDCTLESGIGVSESGYGGWEKPQYCKVGKRVYIRGGVSFTSSSSAKKCFTLPSGFTPPKNHYFLAALGGANVSRCYITNYGNFYVEWIYKIDSTGKVTDTSISWLDISCDFAIE